MLTAKHSRLDAEHGVPEYWIVDPQVRLFDFLVLVHGKYQLHPQDSAVYRFAHACGARDRVAPVLVGD